MISIIVAYDENRGIGFRGKIPWKIKEDMAFFKQKTLFHPVIMGWNTWQSIGKPLQSRTNIILTRNKIPLFFYKKGTNSQYPIRVAKNIEQAISLAHSNDIFIIGGEKVYSLCLEMGIVDRIYASEISGTYECDTFFPTLSREWSITYPIQQYKNFKIVQYDK